MYCVDILVILSTGKKKNTKVSVRPNDTQSDKNIFEQILVILVKAQLTLNGLRMFKAKTFFRRGVSTLQDY